MLNTKQTQEITARLGGRVWRQIGHRPLQDYPLDQYYWIVCANVNHYFLFDADDKIVDVQTD